MWFVIAVLMAAAAFGMAMRRKERGLPLVDRVNDGQWQWVGGVLLLVGYVGGGLIIGRWWATLLLPLLAILIAVPAGENPAYEGDIPWVSFIYVYLLPVWIGLVAVGVVAHNLAGRLGARREEPRSA